MANATTIASNSTNSVDTSSQDSFSNIVAVPLNDTVESTEIKCAADLTHEIRQCRLEKKSLQLVDRIKKCQARFAQCHAFDQLKGLVDYERTDFNRRVANLKMPGEFSPREFADATLNANNSHGNCVAEFKKKMLQNLLSNDNWHEKLEFLFRSGFFKSENFKCEELRRMSPASLAKLLKSYSASRKLTDLLLKFNQLSSTALQTGSSSTSIASALTAEKSENLREVADLLAAKLQDFKRDYDSEATDSSSGGESCDEEEIYVESLPSKLHIKKHKHPPLEERASSRWWSERSSIGSQVALVRTQMLDLDTKIRQYQDVYRQLRHRKQLPSHTRELSSVSKDFTEHSSRTMPVEGRVASRLIRTTGMFRLNRKAARLSTVRCGCFSPLPPCAMCGGRVNNVQTVPDVCGQSKQERACVLDEGYHSSLCDLRGRDMPLTMKMQAYWKLQTITVRSLPKNAFLSRLNGDLPSVTPMKHAKKIMEAGRHERNGKYSTSGRKKKYALQNLTKKDVISALVAKKLSKNAKKNMLTGEAKKSHKRHGLSSSMKMKKTNLISKHPRLIAESRSSSGTSTPASFTNLKLDGSLSSPTPGKLVQNSRRSTTSQNTYDIDNIVIDPSVAAMTRVEKLPYKEIVTPGWRVKEFEPLVADDGLAQTEDTKDETFIVRHDEKELEERKRFKLIYT